MRRRALILAAWLLPLSLEGGFGSAQAEHRQRIAAERDIVRDQKQQHAADQSKNAPTTRADDKVSETDAADQRAAKADEREETNLKVQQRMAAAAEGQERSAFWQSIISFVALLVAIAGTVLVLRTFRETQRTALAGIDAAAAAVRSAELSEAALALSRTTSRIQLRPVVSHDYAQLFLGGDGLGPRVKVQVKNHGATSAKDLCVNVADLLTRWPPQEPPPVPMSTPWSTPSILPPGHSSALELPLPNLTDDNADLMFRHRAGLLLTVRAKYRGSDGEPYETIVNLIAIGASMTEGRVAMYDPAMH